MHGIELLLANCDRLTRLKDLTYFEGVTPEEIKKLKTRINDMNLNICFGDSGKDDNNPLTDDNFMTMKMREKYPPSSEWSESTDYEVPVALENRVSGVF